MGSEPSFMYTVTYIVIVSVTHRGLLGHRKEYHADEKCEITSPSSVSLTSSVPFCFFASRQLAMPCACFLSHILWQSHSLFLLFSLSCCISIYPPFPLFRVTLFLHRSTFLSLFVLFSFSFARKGSREEEWTVLDKSLCRGISLSFSLPYFLLHLAALQQILTPIMACWASSNRCPWGGHSCLAQLLFSRYLYSNIWALPPDHSSLRK